VFVVESGGEFRDLVGVDVHRQGVVLRLEPGVLCSCGEVDSGAFAGRRPVGGAFLVPRFDLRYEGVLEAGADVNLQDHLLLHLLVRIAANARVTVRFAARRIERRTQVGPSAGGQ
jgi:hypothetical protein